MRPIDADALERDYREQFEAVWRHTREVVKPSDFYIERMAAYEKEIVRMDMEAFCKFLQGRPTVDAEPVRHGRWIDEIEPNAVTASGREVHVFRCTACDFTWANKTAVLHYFNYCPNCGAKMDAEGGDQNEIHALPAPACWH